MKLIKIFIISNNGIVKYIITIYKLNTKLNK